MMDVLLLLGLEYSSETYFLVSFSLFLTVYIVLPLRYYVIVETGYIWYLFERTRCRLEGGGE